MVPYWTSQVTSVVCPPDFRTDEYLTNQVGDPSDAKTYFTITASQADFVSRRHLFCAPRRAGRAPS